MITVSGGTMPWRASETRRRIGSRVWAASSRSGADCCWVFVTRRRIKPGILSEMASTR